MKIWSHTLVRNEERYIWYALMSVIDHVDRALIWDTGSEDKTVAIIKELERRYPKKVSFREVGKVDPEEFTNVRQKMLDSTKSDWFILVDGDEVWWVEAIKKHIEFIHKEGNFFETLVTKYFNIIGDIFHYQEEKAGRYSIDGKVGHLNIRFINRKIPGLHFDKPHGQQGLFDGAGVLIQERPKAKRKHMEVGYLHFTNVVRSESRQKDLQVPKRKIKLKYDLGIPFPHDFYYPEVFFRPRPEIVPSPWVKASLKLKIMGTLIAPLKKIKRVFFSSRSGY